MCKPIIARVMIATHSPFRNNLESTVRMPYQVFDAVTRGTGALSTPVSNKMITINSVRHQLGAQK